VEFASCSRKWDVRCSSSTPKEIAVALAEACKRRLPPQSLGHIKIIVEFTGGSIFASSTIIPPEITVQQEGSYSGGSVIVSGVLIFMGLPLELLEDVLSQSIHEAGESMGCTLMKIKKEN
jgi:hypothetical protein